MVIPLMPISFKASLTSSNLNGLMMASIFFMLAAPFLFQFNGYGFEYVPQIRDLISFRLT